MTILISDMNKINKFFLILVFILNFFIRFYNLGFSPAYINWDEASLGINAKCLGTNLRDDYGNFMPVNLRSLDDYKPGLYAYISILPVKLFGLNQFSIRFISAVAGLIALWGIYKISCFFVKDDWIRILGILIIGFGPLRLHFSRVALETNLSAMFVVLSMYCLYTKKYLTMILLAILAMLSYHSARIMFPVLMLLVFFDPIKIIKTKVFRFNRNYLFIFIVYLSVTLYLSLAVKGSLSRFNSEGLFRYWPFIPRNVGNWLYYLGFNVSGRLTSMLNPNNWLSLNYEWFKNSVSFVAQSGILGLIMSLLVLRGLFSEINWQNNKFKLLLYWFISGIVPVILTWNWFYPLRSFNVLPALEIIGLIGLHRFARKKYLIIIILALFGWEMFYTLGNEYNYSNFKNFNGYQSSGIKEISEHLKGNSFDQIIVDTNQENSYLFYQFYGDVDCESIQKIKKDKNNGFQNIVFRKIDWETDLNKSNTVLISDDINKEYMAKEKNNSKIYFIKSPLKLYYSSMIVELN